MKIKHLVITSQEAVERLQSAHDDHEAQEQLHLWGAVCSVAEAVVTEVKTKGVSPTLDQLYDEIKRRYKQ